MARFVYVGTYTFPGTAPGSYTSGDFQVFRINGDGSIGLMTDNFASIGNGTGADPDRQEGPHAHQILTDLDGNHVFGVDLGADKDNVWNLDSGTGKLVPNTVPFAPIASGSGPRHMSFHPDRQHAYVLSELAFSVTVFDYDRVIIVSRCSESSRKPANLTLLVGSRHAGSGLEG